MPDIYPSSAGAPWPKPTKRPAHVQKILDASPVDVPEEEEGQADPQKIKTLWQKLFGIGEGEAEEPKSMRRGRDIEGREPVERPPATRMKNDYRPTMSIMGGRG